MRAGVDAPFVHSPRTAPRGAAACAAPLAAVAIVAVIASAACAPERKVGEPLPASASEARSFSVLSQEILVPRCATSACHSGSPPAAEPSLDADVAWSALVGVPSQQASGTSLVEPFAPEQSYLVMKLRGTAGSAGGLATPMPVGEGALDEADIAAIEAWIANGAPND